MKQLIFSILFCYIALHSTAQINIVYNKNIVKTQENTTKSPVNIIPYDSLFNINISQNDTIQYKKYIGLKLYFPQSKTPIVFYTLKFDSIRCYNSNTMIDTVLWTNIYKPQRKCVTARFKIEKSHIESSDFDSIKNKYYTIVDILTPENSLSFQNTIIENAERLESANKITDSWKPEKITFKLRNNLNGDTVYYNFDNNDDFNHFVIEANYIKYKKLFEGKYLRLYFDYSYGSDLVTDISKSKTYNTTEVGKIFKCTSIDLFCDKDSNFSYVAVLKNNKCEIPLGFTVSNREDELRNVTSELMNKLGDYLFSEKVALKIHKNIQNFLLEDDIKIINNEWIKKSNESKGSDPLEIRLNECVSLFGKKNGTLIANYTIRLGMTKKMCEMAGYRRQMSKTTEQGKTEVYKSNTGTAILENGIVTKIYE